MGNKTLASSVRSIPNSEVLKYTFWKGGGECALDLKNMLSHPDKVAQSVGMSSCAPRVCRFNSYQGTCLGCWFLVSMYGKQSINVYLSHQCFSLPSSVSKNQFKKILQTAIALKILAILHQLCFYSFSYWLILIIAA